MAQRQHAKRHGMALSQIGLLHRATKRQLESGNSEREIYNLLGLPWLMPQDRQKVGAGSLRIAVARGHT